MKNAMLPTQALADHQPAEGIAALTAAKQASQTNAVREAPTFTLLIRAAKLVSPKGEFVCVIRDVSPKRALACGSFTSLPPGEPLELDYGGRRRVYDVNPKLAARHREVGLYDLRSPDQCSAD